MKQVLISLTVALGLVASQVTLANGEYLGGPRAGADSRAGAVGAAIVTFEGAKATDELKTVPDVGAPGLTTTMTETCMGSTSAGVAWLGFGVTGGTTWRDGRCANRLDARQWGQFATQVKEPRYVLVGVELLCEDKGNQRAAARAGVICGPQDDDSPVADPTREVPGPQASADAPLPEWFVANN